jgi:hypothetical protein
MTARIDGGEPFLKYLNVSKTPYIFLTAETDDFDEETIAAWEGEGFVTIYVPYGDGGREYVDRMHAAPDQELGLNDQYAIVVLSPCLVLTGWRVSLIAYRYSIRRCSEHLPRGLCQIYTPSSRSNRILPVQTPGPATNNIPHAHYRSGAPCRRHDQDHPHARSAWHTRQKEDNRQEDRKWSRLRWRAEVELPGIQVSWCRGRLR